MLPLATFRAAAERSGSPSVYSRITSAQSILVFATLSGVKTSGTFNPENLEAFWQSAAFCRHSAQGRLYVPQQYFPKPPFSGHILFMRSPKICSPYPRPVVLRDGVWTGRCCDR